MGEFIQRHTEGDLNNYNLFIFVKIGGGAGTTVKYFWSFLITL